MTGDMLHRRRAARETGSSFVVEASAGTGKTSTLVKRILRLVFQRGPDGVPLKMSDLAAITFTEKAAGEMKMRLRLKLDKYARRTATAALAQAAIRDLDSATISTVHALATALLKERPFEADLDPHFTVLDESRSDLFFREVWEPWLKGAIEERDPPLERALRAGIPLKVVRELAGTLRRHQHDIQTLRLEPPLSREAMDQRRQDLRQEGRELADQVLDPMDKLAAKLVGAIEWLTSPTSADGPSLGGNVGSRANWKGGADAVSDARGFLRRAREFKELWDSWPMQVALHDLLRWLIQGFLSVWEQHKRSAGLLDFDDLLYSARDLLVKNPSVRREFHSRFKALLVDEFQDTDAVQLDLVLLLSSPDPHVGAPSRLEPGPGRLFIVGDPKQSIYRFRGADVENYNSVVKDAELGHRRLEVLELTRNYRSVPSILRFVDFVFDGVMTAPEEGEYQSDYLAFGDAGYRRAGITVPAVHILAERDGEGGIAGSGRDFARIEALRITRLIEQMRNGAEWSVDGKGNGASYRDIAILLPVLTRASLFEDALTEAGIPFVVEGGKYYYARSEVSSAITVLLAVANPNDSVALYGALRSIFFGLSDEDLLRSRMDGLPLDFRMPVPTSSPLSHPYGVLSELHRGRHTRRASETLELLLQRTGAREVLAARGFQSLANLAKLTRNLRSLQEGRTFSRVVEMLQAMDEESFAEQESRLMEERSDAVRIMSIHKAKGLDFRIAIAAGLGIERRARAEPLLADPHGSKTFGLRVSCGGQTITTPGWEVLKEGVKKREDAELVRLLYVALTRARDHLVVSGLAAGGKDGKADFSRTRLAPISGVLLDGTLEEQDLARFIDVAALDSARPDRRESPRVARPDWAAKYAKECDELDRRMSTAMAACVDGSVTAAGKEGMHEETHAGLDAGTAGSRAVRLGIAFHETMEELDFGATPEEAEKLAALVAAHHSLDRAGGRKLVDMVRTTLSSGLLDRVRSAIAEGKRMLRELPLVRPSVAAGPADERKVDLLFEDDGGWVLVDYKTDQIPQDVSFLETKYGAQIREYRDALETLGIRINSAYLLLARTGGHIQIDA